VVGGVDAEAVRRAVAERLPAYMVPTVMVLDALPLTVNGKVDRSALPAPMYDVKEYQEPSTVVEEVVCGVIVELLDRPRVGVDDNFFELGGHSLLAVSLVERLRARGLRLGVRALFDSPTIAALAAVVGQTGEIAVPAGGVPAGAQRLSPEMFP